MTPKLKNTRSKNAFDNVRQSKMSDAELKEEIIKDLTERKAKRDS